MNPVVSHKAEAFKQREQDILATALESFCSDQWESVTVAQIANQVGIAKGTMYLHFTSKNEIYARLALDFYRDLLISLNRPLAGNGINKFRQLVQRAFAFHLERPLYRRVTQYCEREDFKCNVAPEIAQGFDQIDEEIENILKKVLAQSINEDILKPASPDKLIVGLRCTFHGALTLFWSNRHGEQNNPDDFVTTVTDYMLATITTTEIPADPITHRQSIHRQSQTILHPDTSNYNRPKAQKSLESSHE